MHLTIPDFTFLPPFPDPLSPPLPTNLLPPTRLQLKTGVNIRRFRSR